MSTKDCPKCRLTNPKSAEVCDCGHIFSVSSKETLVVAEKNRRESILSNKAKAATFMVIVIVVIKVIFSLGISMAHK